MIDKKKIFFPNLDGLRFIAFSLVYLYHGFGDFFIRLDQDYGVLSRIRLNGLGSYGVSVFFVLSGFLITYLILNEINLKGKLDVKAFYIRRCLRIWPLYYALTILIFVVFPFVKPYLQGQITNSDSSAFYFFTFLSNFDVINTQRWGGNDYTPSNVLWSVSIEEQFYLIWPLIFYFTPVSFYKYALSAVLIVSVIFRYIHADDNLFLYFHTISVCGDLALGGLVAYYSLYSPAFINLFINMGKPLQRLIYGLFFAGILSSSMFHFMKLNSVIGRLWFIGMYSFAILQQNFNRNPIFSLSKFSFITKWGKYTYGLYLTHTLVIVIVSYLFTLCFAEVNNPFVVLLTGTISFFISLLVSYLSYHYFENYFLKLKEKFSRT